jgi:hypothetical protein
VIFQTIFACRQVQTTGFKLRQKKADMKLKLSNYTGWILPVLATITTIFMCVWYQITSMPAGLLGIAIGLAAALIDWIFRKLGFLKNGSTEGADPISNPKAMWQLMICRLRTMLSVLFAIYLVAMLWPPQQLPPFGTLMPIETLLTGLTTLLWLHAIREEQTDNEATWSGLLRILAAIALVCGIVIAENFAPTVFTNIVFIAAILLFFLSKQAANNNNIKP